MPPSLVSMARTTEEKKKNEVDFSEMPTPDYPWGLELSLDDGSMTKLNLTGDSYTPGDKLTLAAIASVTRVESNQEEGETRHRMSLQIQELGLEPTSTNDKDRASKLFGASGDEDES